MNQRIKLDADTRKQQIIEAATAVFTRKGFFQASMDDIVQESGLSKGGLYWHFKSKQDIITAVLDQFFTAEFAELAQILAQPSSATEKLQYLIQMSMRDTLAQLSVYRNIWLEFYAVAAREGAFRERLMGYLRQYIDVMQALIQVGIDNGEFRSLDARQMALAAAAQFEGLILLWAIDPESVDLLALSDTAVALLLNGLSANNQ